MNTNKYFLQFEKYIIHKTQNFINYNFSKKNITNVVMEMWPYPSGNIHMGHARNYYIGDIIYRNILINEKDGINTLHPMGFDSLGLPGENAAIKNNLSPQDWTNENIKRMIDDLKSLNLLYNWENYCSSHEKSYMLLNHKIISKFFQKGYLFRKKSLVNYDESEKTVLANEQVINGLGWRSGKPVIKKVKYQWFLDLPKFANKILNEINNNSFNWDKNTINSQKSFLNKHTCYETEISLFKKTDSSKNYKFYKKLKISTKYPNCIENLKACVLSPGHEISLSNIKEYNINFFNKKLQGILLKNIHCLNPIDNKYYPVFIGNYVMENYGSGAIMCCPNNSKIDNDFMLLMTGQKFLLIHNENLLTIPVNSNKKLFVCKTYYGIKPWLVSRQRFWGCPIPIAFCNKCKKFFEFNSNDSEFVIDKFYKNKNYKSWLKENIIIPCKYCQEDSKIIKETLDTFIDSSWYFLRFINPNSSDLDVNLINKIGPVRYYIGGKEHNNSHLIYSRFFLLALIESGYKINFTNPFNNFISQGMILSPSFKDVNGNYVSKNTKDCKMFSIEKMSKSKCNGILVKEIYNNYPSDVLRLFLISDYPISKDFVFSTDKLKKVFNFYNKLINLFDLIIEYRKNNLLNTDSENLISDITNMCLIADKNTKKQKFNVVISKLYSLYSYLNSNLDILENLNNESFEKIILQICKTFYPICPILSEYIFSKIVKNNTSFLEKIINK